MPPLRAPGRFALSPLSAYPYFVTQSFLKRFWTGKSVGWRLLRMGLLFLVLTLVTLMLMEDKLIYFPARYPDGDWNRQALRLDDGREIGIEELTLSTKDGETIGAWYFTPRRDGNVEATDYVILYCHGNAGNLSHRRYKCAQLCTLPASVLIIDYRGYGKSSGSPKENGLYLDAEAAWTWLIENGSNPEKILINGTSLGGGPAVELARRKDPAGLVLEATFTSIPDMATHAYPFIPRFIVRTKFDNHEKLKDLDCPKLFLHGRQDRVIPFEMSQKNFAAAAEPKQKHWFDEAGHDDIHAFDGYLEAWQTFIQSLNEQDR